MLKRVLVAPICRFPCVCVCVCVWLADKAQIVYDKACVFEVMLGLVLS